MRHSFKGSLCACAALLFFEVTAIRWSIAQSKGFDVRKVANTFAFRPGVIVDSKESTVYLMNPQRGIDAVDLFSGRLIWTTTNAAKPLLLVDRYLVSQAEPAAPDNRLRIVVLDTLNAGKVFLETTVQLPKDVHVAIDDGLGISFRTSARLHEDKVIVSWQYSEQQTSGANLGPNPNLRASAGGVRIDIKTGAAATLTADQLPPIQQTQLPDNVERLIKLGALREPIWQLGDILAAIERTSGKGGQRTVLRRWQSDTGRAMPEVTLFGAEFTFRYTSADSRYLLASRRLDSAKSPWDWRVYSLETGQQVAQIRNALPAAWFFINSSTIFLEVPPTGGLSNMGMVIDQPLRLRAISLDTSDQLWEWPFRDTMYRGPHPPRLKSDARTP
jgi:hypothetical protein